MQAKTLWNGLLRNGDLPELTTQTFIGIMVAITGNVLISLALNLQKLAHKRVETSKAEPSKPPAKSPVQRPLRGQDQEPHAVQGLILNDSIESDGQPPADNGTRDDTFRTASTIIAQELQPLPRSPRLLSGERDYGSRLDTAATSDESSIQPDRRRGLGRRLFAARCNSKKGIQPEESVLLRIDTVSQPIVNRHQNQRCKVVDEHPELEEGNETDYLRSKLWFA